MTTVSMTNTTTFTLNLEAVYHILNQVHACGLFGVNPVLLVAFVAELRWAVFVTASRANLASTKGHPCHA